MFKSVKKFICDIFHIKACQCDEVDEHIEYYTKTPEPDVPVLIQSCPGHRYFKKRCLACQAAQKDIIK